MQVGTITTYITVIVLVRGGLYSSTDPTSLEHVYCLCSYCIEVYYFVYCFILFCSFAASWVWSIMSLSYHCTTCLPVCVCVRMWHAYMLEVLLSTCHIVVGSGCILVFCIWLCWKMVMNAPVKSTGQNSLFKCPHQKNWEVLIWAVMSIVFYHSVIVWNGMSAHEAAIIRSTNPVGLQLCVFKPLKTKVS